MDIEQLKLILETVQGITNDATSGAIWYFVVTYGLSFVTKLMCAAVVIYIVHRLINLTLTVNENEALIKNIRAVVDPNAYGWVSPSERSKILEFVYQKKASNGESNN